jgi:hypothetical protein
MLGGIKQKEMILIYAAVGFGSVALAALCRITGTLDLVSPTDAK